MLRSRVAVRVGLLLLAVVLLGACGATATQSPTANPTATQSPTANPDAALMADLDALWSSPYDAAKVATLYATDAVFDDMVANETSTGLEAIQAKIKDYAAQNFRVTTTSAPIRQGDFVAYSSSSAPPTPCTRAWGWSS